MNGVRMRSDEDLKADGLLGKRVSETVTEEELKLIPVHLREAVWTEPDAYSYMAAHSTEVPAERSAILISATVRTADDKEVITADEASRLKARSGMLLAARAVRVSQIVDKEAQEGAEASNGSGK